MNPTKEYTFLFNAISCLIEDIGSLQFLLMIQECAAKYMRSYGSYEDLEESTDLLLNAANELIVCFQEMQVTLMKAQQQAEEIYLKRTD